MRRNHNDYYSSRKTALDAVMNVIDRGINMLSSNLSEDMFQTWFKYSREILEIVTKDNPALLINYLDFSIALSGSNSAPPYHKLKQCTEYLLEIAKRM